VPAVFFSTGVSTRWLGLTKIVIAIEKKKVAKQASGYHL
jgi:hypothetical protein